jgi:hypothetical protein
MMLYNNFVERQIKQYALGRKYPRVEVIEGLEVNRTPYRCFSRARKPYLPGFTLHNFLCSSCGNHCHLESMAKSVRYSSAFRCIEGWFAAAGLVAQRTAYVQYLTERGYGTRSINVYFRCVAHFVHWFTERGVGASQITEALIDRFLDRHLPQCHCHCLKRFLRVRCQVRPALRHFLAMLRSEGTCSHQPTTDSSMIATELRAFRRHLTEVRGLCESTCSSRLRYVQHFLIDRFRGGPVRVPLLTPLDVCRFMRRYAVGYAPSSIKEVANSLRSYFLFKASQGKLTQPLYLGWLNGDLHECRRCFRQLRFRSCAGPLTAAAGPAEGIMRSPDVFSIWDCAERKWLICGSTMWIGERAHLVFTAKVRVSMSCRYRSSPAEPSSLTFAMGVRRPLDGRSLYDTVRRLTRLPTLTSFAARFVSLPSVADSRSVSGGLTSSGAPSPAVWCKRVRRLSRLRTCFVIAPSIRQRFMPKLISPLSRTWLCHGQGDADERLTHTVRAGRCLPCGSPAGRLSVAGRRRAAPAVRSLCPSYRSSRPIDY